MKILAIGSLLVVALFKCDSNNSSTLNLSGNAVFNKDNCETVNNASSGTSITIEGYTVSGFLKACKLAGYI